VEREKEKFFNCPKTTVAGSKKRRGRSFFIILRVPQKYLNYPHPTIGISNQKSGQIKK
jgi:hypothetical protein